MKAHEVLKLLRISRITLSHWVKKGTIRISELPNGYYNYNEEDVYKILNKNVVRKNYLYARVSTSKQKKDLENQVEMLKQWCFGNGTKIDGVFQDVASGISFEKRKEFFHLLDEVMDHRVDSVIITYKDRISRVEFDLFSVLFEKFGTKIVVVSEIGSKKLDSEEVFEEIVSLLHCYSMKLYGKRTKKGIEVTTDAN